MMPPLEQPIEQSIEQPSRSIYRNGQYLAAHPNWHAEDSTWKAAHILQMFRRNRLTPETVCEIGCGAGEILKQLQEKMDPECSFRGYEVSPQAFELCKEKENESLHFLLNARLDTDFDVLLIIDVVEHIEDFFGFLRSISEKGDYKIFHIPLDLSAQGLLQEFPMKVRRELGHLHYFTKETALESLRECGYQVLDFFYTAGMVDLPATSWKREMAKLPRRVLFPLHRDWAVRLMGGYSLLVLAR
jgi:hypothetical protein